MEKGFIREYDFLIREGWMDGEQHGKNVVLVHKIVFFEKMVISCFGEIRGKSLYIES